MLSFQNIMKNQWDKYMNVLFPMQKIVPLGSFQPYLRKLKYLFVCTYTSCTAKNIRRQVISS